MFAHFGLHVARCVVVEEELSKNEHSLCILFVVLSFYKKKKKNADSISETFMSLSGSNKRLYWKLRNLYSYHDHLWSTDSREEEAEQCLAIDGRIISMDNFTMKYTSYL